MSFVIYALSCSVLMFIFVVSWGFCKTYRKGKDSKRHWEDFTDYYFNNCEDGSDLFVPALLAINFAFAIVPLIAIYGVIYFSVFGLFLVCRGGAGLVEKYSKN